MLEHPAHTDFVTLDVTDKFLLLEIRLRPEEICVAGLPRGGILADQMGLGKTVQVLALIDSRPREMQIRQTPGAADSLAKTPTNATLVVRVGVYCRVQRSPYHDVNISRDFHSSPHHALRDMCAHPRQILPSCLVHQWAMEARKFVPHLTVYQYQGCPDSAAARNEVHAAIQEADIVLATYETLRADFHRQQPLRMNLR